MVSQTAHQIPACDRVLQLALTSLATLLTLLTVQISCLAQGILVDDAHTSTAPKTSDANFGTNPNLFVNAAGNVYVKFKLSSTLPAGTSASKVERATLKLYLANVTTPGKLDVYAVSGAWDEASITGRNAPILGNLLSTTPQIDVNKRNEFLVIDITSAVQQWLGDDGQGSNGIPNYGLAVVAHPADATTPEAANITFDSKENSQTSHEAQLNIQLSTSTAANGGITEVTGNGPITVTNSTTTPSISLGLVPTDKGGTGLNSPGATGNFLRSDGSGWTTAPLSGADIPDLAGSYIRNATSLQSSSNFNIGGTGNADIFNALTQYNIGGNRVLSNAGTNNLFAGIDAGTSNTTGTANAFVGRNAGQSNISGSSNSFVGNNAGAGATTGGNNSFFGDAAGFRNGAANDNSFFGFLAGFHTTVSNNSFFGSLAGADNTTGSNNAFFGRRAGVHNTTGLANSFFGDDVGVNNTSGVLNSFFGRNAGFSNTDGSANSFFGEGAGTRNTTGGSNVFVGRDAGFFNTTGNSNVLVGLGTGQGNTTGSNITLVGTSTNVGADNLSFATAIGAGAVVSTNNTLVLGRSSDTVQIPGATNVSGSFGALTLDVATQYNIRGVRVLSVTGNGFADSNTFVGVSAGENNAPSNIDGMSNSFVGMHAGRFNSSGRENSFFGAFAGEFNTTGNSNSFFGLAAGGINGTGQNNSFFGVFAGQHNNTGGWNTFVGSTAGSGNTTGSLNTYVGQFAGVFGSIGSRNTFIGQDANVGGGPDGDNNTLVGSSTRVDAEVSNSSAIGYRAQVTQNNSLVLGSISGVNFGTDTNVGIGTTAPKTKFHLKGGKIYVEANGSGMILKSPGGACFELTVTDAGALTTAAVTCP